MNCIFKRLPIALVLLVGSCMPILAEQNTALKQIAKPFSVRDVQLLDGPFRHAQDLDAAYLLTIEPDRLLSWFRKEAKLEPQAKQDYAGASIGGKKEHASQSL